MRLLQKTNRSYLLLSTLMFLVVGALLYFIMTDIIDEEVTEKLYTNKKRIAQKIENGAVIPQLPPVLETEKLPTYREAALLIKDTLLYDPMEEEPELFRELTAIENIKGESWRITLRQVILEPHDYLNPIATTLVIVMALLLIGLFLVNRMVSQKLWQPFYRSMAILKSFSLQDNKPVKLPSTSIVEFNELNQAIGKLTQKVQSDFRALKEFTENASHEIQTPLSIIQSKLELFLQSSTLSEQQAKEVKAAYAAAQRLSKLNQSLLLLTKIENQQFTAVEPISLAAIVDRQIDYFQGFIQVKNLRIKQNIKTDYKVNANLLLVEILLTNLLGNAIKYSIPEGCIQIELEGNNLSIVNQGKAFSGEPKRMFERFTKARADSESTGLGLAIVKKICIINQWQVTYTTQDNWHILRLIF